MWLLLVYTDIHASVIFSLHALIYVVLHDYVMALFCQVKDGKLLEDVGTQVSNLATKVMKYYSVSDLPISNLQIQLISPVFMYYCFFVIHVEPDSNISHDKSSFKIIIYSLSKYICTGPVGKRNFIQLTFFFIQIETLYYIISLVTFISKA
jgi:hypothetical protein